ncbi:GAF and ANTAR domain-containing protein [Rhodococcus aerolatus]
MTQFEPSTSPAPTEAPRDGVRALIRKAVAGHPEEMADVMASLAWSVHDEDELLEYLHRCAELSVRVIDGAHSAGVTAHVGDEPFTAAHTDDLTLEIDARQYRTGEGPCLQAIATGHVVRADVAATGEQWPRFTEEAVAIGVRSFLAAPLSTAPSSVGALNLYSTSEEGFSDDDVALLLIIADHATRALDDYARLHAAENLAAQLQQALAHRAPIEQAKGILMAARGVDEDAAFDLLRTESQNTNTKLHAVAVAFVARHTAG